MVLRLFLCDVFCYCVFSAIVFGHKTGRFFSTVQPKDTCVFVHIFTPFSILHLVVL